ncbi:MAG: hypothetical protein ISS80_03400 [Candidatus Cloacimonetes bacterium]|nr:hypothetical protein [Candidatus Cloacimonadota bacterium]MBL7149098.1 hypothetical protein [Candidatus Cloacimonadota bacterium]
MLIRIASDMFSDPKFECKTINIVRTEFISTPQFKDKYPWRKEYVPKVKSANLTDKETINYNLKIINTLSESKINQKTNTYFSLSKVDKQIVAQIIELEDINISTGDQDLIDFLDQEFDISNVYPLRIIIDWLKVDLIEWNKDIETILEDWNDKNEKAQPLSAKIELQKITGYNYSGLVFED